MKGVALSVAAGCVALFVGALAFVALREFSSSGRITAQQAALRYQQCQPGHWRTLFLRP